MKKKRSVLVFGLDGGTWKIIGPLMKKGELPYLKKLAKKGKRLTLESVIPPISGAAWASFQTGADPGGHGIFDFIKRDGDLISSRDVELPPIWDILAKRGCRSCVLNMPVTYPVKPMNGILVSSFLADPDGQYYYPAELEEELKKLNYKVDLKNNGPLKFADLVEESDDLSEEVEEIALRRSEAARKLIEKEAWDFFFCMFKSVDIMQHLDYNGEKTKKLHKKIDGYVREIVEKFEKLYPEREVDIIVMSDHGFHEVSKKDIALYPLLRKLGFATKVPRVVLKAARGLRRVLDFKLKLGRITAYGMFTKNREKQEKIVEALRKYKYKGKKVFTLVERQENLYKSKHENIPDILWLTDPYFSPNADLLSEKLTYPHKSPVKGNHHADPEGIGIIKSEKVKRVPKRAKIYQLTTLIAELLEVAYPDYFEKNPFELKRGDA